MEVLISITILAFLALGMYSIISNGTTTKDRTLSEDRQFLQVQMAIHRMAQDFAQVYSPLYHSYVEEGRPNRERRRQGRPNHRSYKTTTFPRMTYQGLQIPIVSNEDEGEITFLTTSNRRKVQDNKESHYAWISYSLENNPNEDKRADSVIIRRVLSFDPYTQDVVREDSFTEQRLLDNVSSLKFEFWDSRRKRFVERTRDMTSEIHLLRSIKATLVWVNGQGHEETFERIFRPLFPFFDTEKDKKERDKIVQEIKKRQKEERAKREGNRRRGNPPPNSNPRDNGAPAPGGGSEIRGPEDA